MLVLDRWTDPSVDDAVLAKQGLPVNSWQVGSDRYVNQNDKKTFDIPVREGTTFLLHHCVTAGEPLQTRSVSANELADAPETDRLLLVTLDGPAGPPAARPSPAADPGPRVPCGRLTTVTSETGQRALDVGLGAGGLATADMVLNIGPQHPATHGVLRLRVVLDGERIISAEPVIGYMHRGAEKLFEVRDYRQITVLANRHDWLSAFSNELGVVLGVEAMLGMEVPERAVWLRTLLAELNRVLSHLMFLGSYPLELGAITPVFYAFREREELQAVMEEASGGRMHYMFNRVGGLKEDVPAGWLGRVEAAVNGVRRRLPELESLIVGNEIVEARTRGVGVLDIETCLAYGVSGPIARASGLDVDLRRDDPYLAYATLFAPGGPGRVVTRTAGDCLARLEVLLEQVHVSLDLAAGLPRHARDAARRPGQPAAAQGAQGARGRALHRHREPARVQRLLPGLARREDPVAAQAALGVVQQRAGALAGAARLPRGRHGGRARLDVLRRRRRRQVGAGGPAVTARALASEHRARRSRHACPCSAPRAPVRADPRWLRSARAETRRASGLARPVAGVVVVLVGRVDAAPALGHEPGRREGHAGDDERTERQQPALVRLEREVGQHDHELAGVPPRGRRAGERGGLGQHDGACRAQRVERASSHDLGGSAARGGPATAPARP